ncbi:WXG100 family type VII secretion target [Bacillus paramobilis]|uniref:WXG100 family type VII secretion target n=1 Tax=Bacillus paramobilis TaxID=2817477 RepID=UPI003217AB2E
MVQIKVTPEMLEEVANRANNTRIALESIHNNLCNEIDYLCSQWIGASNQQFVQMFNDARPKAFTSINSIIQVEEDLKRIAEKFRNTDNQDVTMEKGAMCGPLSSEKEGFDGKKLARDIAGEISGEYDVRRVWDGIDPSTGEKLSGWERTGAGVMAVAGLTPFGKIAKVGKGVKMTANAVEAANTVKKAEKVENTVKKAENFADKEKLIGHFDKHGGEFKGAYENAEQYLQGARDVIENGIKVKYDYKGEVRTGYVKYMGNTGKGKAKFELVGTNNEGYITTYHTQSGKTFWRTLNGKNEQIINPAD